MQYAKTGKKIYDKTQNIYWKPFKTINKKRLVKFNNVKCDAAKWSLNVRKYISLWVITSRIYDSITTNVLV